MIYTVHIPNKEERIELAVEIKRILKNCGTYIPKANKQVFKSDIGIKANVDKKELGQVLGLIKRRGYSYYKRESRTESALTL